MARYKKLDRSKLLDAALEVILTKGPHALSIGNVATAANATKGGIQSNFGTKDQLIDALFERWSDELAEKTCNLAEKMPDASDLDLFLRATWETNTEKIRQGSAMFILMSLNEDRQKTSQEWVSDAMQRFGLHKDENSIEKLRFTIFQALMIVQSLGLMPYSMDEWENLVRHTDDVLIAASDDPDNISPVLEPKDPMQ